MSVLESRINSIASIAIDASVNKADTRNPVFYGSASLNKVPEFPDNSFNCNVPATFNSAVSVVDTLKVYGNAFLDNDVTVKSTLYVEGRSLLNGSSTILSDLYVSGNAYFRSSSIGSYLQISDYNSTMNNHFYTQSTTNSLLH